MERLLSAKEVAGIVGFRDMDRARRVIRECVHTENPLRVSESALQAWISNRTYRAGGSDAMVEDAQGETRIPRRRGDGSGGYEQERVREHRGRSRTVPAVQGVHAEHDPLRESRPGQQRD